MIEIQDDFLWPHEYAEICSIKQNHFPWYSQDSTDFEGDGNPQFTHMFYQNLHAESYNFGWSDYNSIIMPLVKKINPFCVLKIKANMTLDTEAQSNFHMDFEDVESRVPPAISALFKTSIYYLDDDLGGTEFKDTGQIIPTKANRLVTFDSCMLHRSVLPKSGGNRRVVINMNYIPYSERNKHGTTIN